MEIGQNWPKIESCPRQNTKFQQALLITLGVADQKPEGGGAKSPSPRKIGLTNADFSLVYEIFNVDIFSTFSQDIF